MKKALWLLLFAPGLWALADGELRFSLAGKLYSTQNAAAVIQKRGEKTRIMIAVKDISQRFMLVLTADVEKGSELKPLQLTTEDSDLSVTLRTMQGSLAVLPSVQLARVTDHTYVEQVLVETDELEDDPDDHRHRGNGHEKRKRRKVRPEYRRVKPRWHTMSREERLRSGEGVIGNRAFQDVFFSLRLTPVLNGGKVVSYEGTFSGTGRFSRSIAGAQVKPVEGGAFRVRVENAQ